MPESVTDRPTKSHEQIFLFSKARWSGPVVAPLTAQDARWLALLIETEGNIIVKHVTRPDGREWFGGQIAVANTSRALIEECARIAGCGAISTRPGLNAPVHYWQTSNRKAAAILRAIYPHMIVKRRQAAIVIHLQELLRHRGGRGPDRLRSDEETATLRSLWQDCKACNRFGTPDLGYVPEPKLGQWRPERYFYDAEAIREPYSMTSWTAESDRDGLTARGVSGIRSGEKGAARAEGAADGLRYGASSMLNAYGHGGRNRRSVWTVATQPFPEAHFATFPEALVEPCILAGSKPGDLVLDPFAGSGTVGVVSLRHGRRFLGLELNPKYCEMARRRVAGPLFAGAAQAEARAVTQGDK